MLFTNGNGTQTYGTAVGRAHYESDKVAPNAAYGNKSSEVWACLPDAPIVSTYWHGRLHIGVDKFSSMDNNYTYHPSTRLSMNYWGENIVSGCMQDIRISTWTSVKKYFCGHNLAGAQTKNRAFSKKYSSLLWFWWL